MQVDIIVDMVEIVIVIQYEIVVMVCFGVVMEFGVIIVYNDYIFGQKGCF